MVEASTGPGARFARAEVLAAVARLDLGAGNCLRLGLGSAHERLATAAVAEAAQVAPVDLLRHDLVGIGMQLAPDPAGVVVVSAGPMRLWASGTGTPGAWVLEGVADS